MNAQITGRLGVGCAALVLAAALGAQAPPAHADGGTEESCYPEKQETIEGDGGEVIFVDRIYRPFDDVPDDAFFTQPVRVLVVCGATGGCSATMFCPHDPVTRGQAATLLHRLAGETGPYGPGFDDVEPGVYYDAPTRWLRAAGLTTGVGGTNRFEPLRPLTRAEVVTLLHRFAGSPEIGVPQDPTADKAPRFTDVPHGSYYDLAVAWAHHHGITTGVGGSDRFEPDREVTRAEGATFLARYLWTDAARGDDAVPTPGSPARR